MSITGQTGHVAFSKQSVVGTPMTTGYKAVKITGDSLVANNNPLVAEGEIGSGRDVTQTVPGGFSAAGAINGNLRARSASILLEGAFGSRAPVIAAPPAAAFDDFDVADTLPLYTVEKKVGTTGQQLLVLQYADTMINTLSISATSGGLTSFSAGLIAMTETEIASPNATQTYNAAGDDLLVFHGGRVLYGDSADGGAATLDRAGQGGTGAKDPFQSFELSFNNNIAADEYTIRPSRGLRSLTEGIRTIEVNMTIVFENQDDYERFTYGAAARTAPGYNLYMGAFDITLANWQIVDADTFSTAAATGVGPNPQAVHLSIPKVAFSGMPVTLSTGRIAVATTGRVLKPATGNIIDAQVRPQQSAV